MNQVEMTHCGRSHSSDCCEDHGAAFGHGLEPEKMELLDLFLAKAAGLRKLLGQNVGTRYFAGPLIRIRSGRIREAV